MNSIAVLKNFQKNFPQIIFYTSRNNLIVKVPASILKNVLYFLQKNSKTRMSMLIDISAVDYIERKFRFEIFYNLLSITKNCRLIITTSVYENKYMESVTSIYPSAN